MQAEQKRIANAAASRAMGSPIKVELISGAAAKTNGGPPVARVRRPAVFAGVLVGVAMAVLLCAPSCSGATQVAGR